MIISGVSYAFSGFPVLNLFYLFIDIRYAMFLGIHDVLISIMFGILFLKAAWDTEKSSIEAQNASTPL
jgi:hypothetical protein